MNKEQYEAPTFLDTKKLPDHIEDVPETPADPETVLTDEQLTAGGLVKVNAFMRSKASANALRVQKHREKKEAEGVKQINVQASEEARQAIKAIADRTKSGETLPEVLASLAGTLPSIPQLAKKTETPDPKAERLTIEEKQLVQIGHQVRSLTGWRKALARIIGLTTS